MAGSWAFATRAFGDLAEGVSAVRSGDYLNRTLAHVGLGGSRGSGGRFWPVAGRTLRAVASEYASDRVQRSVTNAGMQGGAFFHLPGTSAMWRRLGSRAGGSVRAFLEPRGAWQSVVRRPFVRYPRMFARPVPQWQAGFVRPERRMRRRRRGRDQFFLGRDAWRSDFRSF